MKISVQHGSLALLTCLAAPAPGQAQTLVERGSATAATALPADATGAREPSDESLEADLDEEEDLEPEIVIAGVRQRGAVDTNIPPEVQLHSRAIRALGVGTVEDVLEELAPQLRGGGGDEEEEPVVLLNGRRVSSFNEIRDLPPEAIYRVDVFPQEASLQYGYPADRRLVNFVLRRRYKSLSLQGRYTFAPKRSRSTYRGKSTLLRLKTDRRWHVDLDLRREEGVLAGENEGAEFAESLIPRTDRLIANSVVNRTIGTVTATGNARLRLDRNARQLFYLEHVAIPAARVRDTVAGHGGLTFNGDLGRWRWSLIGNVDLSDAHSRDRQAGVGGDRLRRTSTEMRSAGTSLLASGALAELPSGPITVAAEAGVGASGLESQAVGLFSAPPRRLNRSSGHSQFNLEVPVVSQTAGTGHVLGDVSANFNARLERVSGFGTLTRWGYGLRWNPVPFITLLTSQSREKEAPTLEQLGEALQVDPSLRVFDFRLARTGPAILLEGGAPGLNAEQRSISTLRLQARPPGIPQLLLSAEYVRSREYNAIVTNLGPTLAVEAAFPQRFARDGQGILSTFDARPVNFDRVARQQLRWGVNYATPQPASRSRQAAAAALPTDAASRAAAAAENSSAVPPRGRPAQLSFAVYHTWHLQHDVRIRGDLPRLNLLNGAAVSRRGSQPRHELEFQGGFAKNGLGARVSAEWESTRRAPILLGTDGLALDELTFTRVPRLNLHLFIDLGAQAWLRRVPWLRGRLNINIEDLLNSRTRVEDRDGETPLAFERSYTEPVGRAFRITLRKNFRSR